MVIRSTKLSCEKSTQKTFNCTTVIESGWVRVWDTTYYQDVINYCGMQWHEQYQDVMYWLQIIITYRKVPCVINGTDYMLFVKEEVNKTSSLTVTISARGEKISCVENRKPLEYGEMHYGGECVWEYEIEGFWSTCMI